MASPWFTSLQRPVCLSLGSVLSFSPLSRSPLPRAMRMVLLLEHRPCIQAPPVNQSPRNQAPGCACHDWVGYLVHLWSPVSCPPHPSSPCLTPFNLSTAVGDATISPYPRPDGGPGPTFPIAWILARIGWDAWSTLGALCPPAYPSGPSFSPFAPFCCVPPLSLVSPSLSLSVFTAPLPLLPPCPFTLRMIFFVDTTTRLLPFCCLRVCAPPLSTRLLPRSPAGCTPPPFFLVLGLPLSGHGPPSPAFLSYVLVCPYP